jgi:hypothetical protein
VDQHLRYAQLPAETHELMDRKGVDLKVAGVLQSLGEDASRQVIGSQRRGAGVAGPSPHSPFEPCKRFSRTRLTDGLLSMVTLPPDSGWCHASGTG